MRSIFWNWLRACIREFSVCSLKKKPVWSWITVSRAPPFWNAITGRPLAMDSRGVMPKSSIWGKIRARALA